MMTNEELENLFETTMRRVHELETKYEMGFGLTRKDCLEMRTCTNRLYTVAFELWNQQGRPEGFDLLRQPPPKRPLPAAFTLNDNMEVH